jgi:hypothetical protein
MKKIRGDKSVGFIIHIYMEKTQENTLCSYLHHKQANVMVFFFFFLFFSSTILENRRGNRSCPKVGLAAMRGEVLGKGGSRVNMVQKCVHMYVMQK